MDLIIFTDLDATLLEHNSYSYQKAIPALNKIKEQNLPLVIVTSKTRKEVENLVNELEIKEPFIVENGAAIFFPKNYRNFKIKGAKEKDNYFVIELGKPYEYIRNFVEKYKDKFGIVGFGDLSIEEIAEFTQLPLDKAKFAKKREYTEPFLLKDESKINQLEKVAIENGLKITKGGRFYHIIGKNQDKGKAVKIVKDIFKENLKKELKTVALGDSKNDIPMLKEADIPVLIPKNNGTYEKTNIPNIIKAKKPSSEGWNHIILNLIS